MGQGGWMCGRVGVWVSGMVFGLVFWLGCLGGGWAGGRTDG